MVALAERFWVRVSKGPGCWMWDGPPGSHGYGQVSVGGSVTTAHRTAFELTYGSIPEGLFVLHKCDTKLCVRPATGHLYLGTHQDNMDDVSRSRSHPTRRLGGVEVDEIRALLSRCVPQRRIAAMFGLTQRSVWNIHNGRTYRHG